MDGHQARALYARVRVTVLGETMHEGLYATLEVDGHPIRILKIDGS